MRISTATAAALLALQPALAVAADDTSSLGADYDTAPSGNIYIEGRGSIGFLADQSTSGAVDGDAEYNLGFGAGAAVGYHVTDDFRVEGEFVIDVNDMDKATPITPTAISQAQRGQDPREDGDTLTLGGFVNGAYDINTGTALTPYIGGGLGLLHIDAEYGAYVVDDTDIVPAYQARAGITWNVTRRTGLILGYRFRGAFDDATFDSPSGDIRADYTSHTLEMGLRYRF